jgi:hypothetical protein
MKMNLGKLKPFLVLVTTQMVFACIVFLNELYAIWNRFPGGNYPIEHKFSWARVLLFCVGTIISALVVWGFVAKKHLSTFLPPFKLVLLFAIIPTLAGVLSNYPSVTGWCCEVSPTRYFGFPFSYMRGNSLFETLLNFDLAKIIKYNFLAYPFFLNFLFWSSTVFIFASLASLFFQKGKIARQVKGQVQSGNS